MAYVDLNPVRASMAATPETSNYTSFKERITPLFDPELAIQQQLEGSTLRKFSGDIKLLLPFLPVANQHQESGIPCAWGDYLQLVDWTGNVVREDKLGAITAAQPPILERLNIQPKNWLKHATEFEYYHPKVFNREEPTIAFSTG